MIQMSLKVARITLAAVFAVAFSAQAQTYPDKPVRIIVPAPPGGNMDITARIISSALQAEYKVPFVVENKAGATGLIGTDFVVKSKPDGYTLIFGSNAPLSLSPIVYPNAPYDPVKDLAAISTIALTPMVVVVSASTPARNMQDLVALAKKEPGVVSMGTTGAGSINHLALEFFQTATGTKYNLIHYKGNSPMITDLLGGQIQGAFDQLTSALPHIKSGKVRALAVTSTKRVLDLPEVPTLEEAGFAGHHFVTYTGMAAPKGTPVDIVNRLNAAVNKVLAQTAVKDQLAASGAIAQGATVDEFTRFLREEQVRWSKVVREANIKPGN